VKPMCDKRDTDRNSIVKHDDNIPRGKFGLSLEDNVKIDFQQIGWEGVNWIDLARTMDK
jgi:hypothetical protein